MPASATLFLIAILLIFTALDLHMLVTLLSPGDERNQIIVWKASSFTLLAITGSTILDVVENVLRGQAMTINPLIHLEVTAILYCLSLLFYKKRLGG